MSEEIVATVQQAEDSAVLIRKAERLIKRHVGLDQFDIGDLLYEIDKRGIYREKGFNTVVEFAKELGLKESKARYLPRISRIMELVGIPRIRYEAVTVSRLRAITSLKPEEIYTNPNTGEQSPMTEYIKLLTEECITKGESFPLVDVQRLVGNLKGFTGERDLVWRNLRFMRSVAEGVWDQAIELIKRHIGSVGKDEDGNSIDPSDASAAEKMAAIILQDPNLYEESVGQTDKPDGAQQVGDADWEWVEPDNSAHHNDAHEGYATD